MTLNSDLPQQNQKLLLVFGAGGHGRVVADAALLQGQWSRVMASSRSLPTHSNELLPDVDLVDLQAPIHREAALHIGNNTARQTEAQAFGLARLVSVVHPLASVSTFSHMDAGCFVAARAVVTPAARLGIGVIVNHCAVIDHDTEIGDFSHVGQNASVCGHSKLGQRVLNGSGAVVMSSVVVGFDLMLSPGSVANCDLLAAGVYSGISAVKIE